MSKDTYYFSHDANARNDEKVLMLRADHGWEGYGIYWVLIEMMFESTETALHHKKIKGIAVSYNIDITVLESVINTCISEELFVSDGTVFWSESLRKRKGKFQEMKEKKAEAGRKGMAKRWGKDNSVITDDNTIDNSVITKNNKVKESKVKESKEKDYTTEFDSFWKDYPKKADKPYAFTKFKSAVKKHGLEKVMTGLKGYIEAVEDKEKQFIKNPGTFLNKGSYLDYLEVEEEEPTVKVTEEQRIRYRMSELDGVLTLGLSYWKDKPEEYYSAEREYEELERKLQSC